MFRYNKTETKTYLYLHVIMSIKNLLDTIYFPNLAFYLDRKNFDTFPIIAVNHVFFIEIPNIRYIGRQKYVYMYISFRRYDPNLFLKAVIF